MDFMAGVTVLVIWKSCCWTMPNRSQG